MKTVLIIYPHWPPSNLAGVHRARLISNFLPDFDWHPIILTVHEDFYEEKLDVDFLKTVRSSTEVIKVKARPVNSSRRFIGDIGLRAFFQLRKKASQLLRDRKIDFIWVPIPSYYTTLMLPGLYKKYKTPYGIDYIDPWVKPRDVLGSFMSKAYVSNIVARLLEPYAVGKAALISGVDEAYYQPVLDRNFKGKKVVHVGMPYGFDPKDHQIQLENVKLPWNKGEEAYVYAGAFLPKSHLFLKSLFKVIAQLKANDNWIATKKLYFLGTGTYPGKQIKEYAREYGIDELVVEKNERFPFLHILYFLNQAKGVIVLGSTEKHYTASKIFQSLLSQRPVFAIFHHQSSAVTILKESNSAQFLVEYYEGMQEGEVINKLGEKVEEFFLENKNNWRINLVVLDKYSSQESTKGLIQGIDKIV
jgi:hypothetical protein